MIRRILTVGYWCRSRSLLTALLIAAVCPFAWADPTAPGALDRQITKSITYLLDHHHLSRHPLDNEISERCLKMYLKALDPMKAYFYQSDIDEFTRHKDELSNAARKGDLSFAYHVFQVFLQRIDERVKTVDELLASPHDFSVDEEMLKDRDSLQYAHDPAEARDRWRKRIKYELLDLKADKNDQKADKKDQKADKNPGEDAATKLARRYHSFVKRMHKTDGGELLEIYLNTFTMSFDPHTSYMSPRTQEDFAIAMRLELTGIGASLKSEDGYTVVKELIPRGAAAKDGRLKSEDKIVGVGQNGAGEMVDVVDWRLRDVVDLIRGKPGTIVRLEVIPVGSAERKVYNIVREKIELKDSEAKGEVFDAGRKPDGSPYRIGVIDLPSFYRDMERDRRGSADFRSATHDVRAILEDFNRKNVDAVVLDLRRNGGGALNEAISLTGLFIDEGPVVQVKDADGRVQHLDDMEPGMTWRGPLVVMISKFSASASEILAGAIQDYGRGLIIGDRSTHGKGTVQSLLELTQLLFPNMPNVPSMGALKITQSQFYRPNGDSTQKRGVLSDVELPWLTTHLDVGEADLDYPAEFDKVEPLRYKHFDYVNPTICGQLRRLSQQRVEASEKFQKVVRNIARYKEQKAKKSVTLNEEKFLKERAELNADKEEEKAIGDHSDLSSDTIERDFYLDEVLAITTDYLNQQHVARLQREAPSAN